MSFLGVETDDESESSATLQDVLGFIDAYEEPAAVETISPRDKRGIKSVHAAADTRRARSQSYRIRDEMLRLRREAQALETRIAELKSGTDRNYELQLMMLRLLNSNAHRSKRWIETVLQEYRRRQDSERVNRQLKALLAKQMRVIQSSETAFGVFTETEVSLVFDQQRVLMAQHSAMDEAQIMALLGDRMNKLELNVDSVVHGICSESMSSLLNPNAGVSFESSSCTTIPCSVEQADAMLVQQFYRKVAKRSATMLDFNIKDVRIIKHKQFQHEQQSYELVGKGRMRKIDHPEHVVFVRSSLITLPSERLSFIEESIVVICRPNVASNPSSESGAILVNWHCAHAQHDDQPSALEPNGAMGTLKQKFIGASSDRDRHHMRKIKHWLCEVKPRSPVDKLRPTS